jgi:hypothetical protein
MGNYFSQSENKEQNYDLNNPNNNTKSENKNYACTPDFYKSRKDNRYSDYTNIYPNLATK